MGACGTKLAATLPEELVSTKRQFREERSEFEITGRVDYNEDEFKFDLRTMLDDPMGQKMLSQQAAKLMNREANTRATKTQLMLISLFAAFDDDFNHGLPLPRSPTTRSIGIDQAVKDAVRERIEVNGAPVRYSVAASDCPEVAAAELTELLCSSIREVTGTSFGSPSRADLGRLVGRILGALCRTGSGGDTYCAVNALFDIAGTMEKSRGLGGAGGGGGSSRGGEEVGGAKFPFLIMPANVLGEGDELTSQQDVDVPGPLRVTCGHSDDGERRPIATVVTTSLLDVHLADKVLQPSVADSGRRRGKMYRNKNESGMAKPLVRLKATIVEVISMEVGCSDRERSLRLEVL